MTEENNNQIPSEAYYLHPSNMPGAYEEFRADHSAMEDELIEKAIARVMSKSIESIGNIMIEQIQFLGPYLLISFLMITGWILRKLFLKYQPKGVPSVQSVREDSQVPPVVNVEDSSSKKSYANKSYAGGLKLSVWDTEGIDVRDSTMAKEIAYQKKSMLDNPIDLTTQNFEKLRRAAKDKVATIRFEKEIEYSIQTQDEEVEAIGNIIQNAKSIPLYKVQERERRVWFGENEFEAGDHDRRLKSNVLGETLKASLSASARTTIETNYKGKYEIEFEGRNWVSGPLLLWCIMQEMSLSPWQEIDSKKEQFRTAKIQGDINKSLDYLSKIVKRVQELGGVIHDSDIVSKVHSMLDTITSFDDPKMAEFLQFRNTLRREDQTLIGKGKQGRSSNTLISELKGEYIRIFGESKKSNASRKKKSDSDDGWTEVKSKKKCLEAKLSQYPKDKLVQAVALLAREGNRNTNNSNKQNGGANKRPAWKEEKPKDGEKVRNVDGVDFTWCQKCNKGNGMWTTHEKHLDRKEYRAQQKEKNDSNKEKSSSTPGISINKTSLNSLRRGDLSFLDSESKD